MEEFKRQHDSYIVVGKDGQIKFDGILKDGEGLKVFNKRQEEAFKRKMEKREGIIEHIKNEEGDFVHFVYKYMCPAFMELEKLGNKANIHIMRFIVLATYLNNKNNLYDLNNNRIKKSSLAKVWNTENNRKSVNETINTLKKYKYIYETEEGYIMINNSLIQKGEVKNFRKMKKEDINTTYTRLFSENIREMYQNTDAKARKQLAYLFKVLPYVSYKHNILCKNPHEKEKDKLDLLTWTDVAEICEIDTKNVTRFKNQLFKLSVQGFDVIGQFSCKGGYYICINPKLYYSGDSLEDVEFLYKSFEMFEKKD